MDSWRLINKLRDREGGIIKTQFSRLSVDFFKVETVTAEQCQTNGNRQRDVISGFVARQNRGHYFT